MICSSLVDDYFLYFGHFLGSVVLGLGLWLHSLSAVHFGMSNGTILVQFIFREWYWWHFISIVTDLLEDTAHSELTDSKTHILLPNLLQCFLRFRCRSCFVNVSTGTGLHTCVFWFVVVCCKGLHLLLREVSTTKGNNTLIYGYKHKYLECK